MVLTTIRTFDSFNWIEIKHYFLKNFLSRAKAQLFLEEKHSGIQARLFSIFCWNDCRYEFILTCDRSILCARQLSCFLTHLTMVLTCSRFNIININYWLQFHTFGTDIRDSQSDLWRPWKVTLAKTDWIDVNKDDLESMTLTTSSRVPDIHFQSSTIHSPSCLFPPSSSYGSGSFRKSWKLPRILDI